MGGKVHFFKKLLSNGHVYLSQLLYLFTSPFILLQFITVSHKQINEEHINMLEVDKIYCNAVEEILRDGEVVKSRVGEVTRKFFIPMTFNLWDGSFPILTLKWVPFKIILAELMWFIEGGSKTGHRMDENRLRDFVEMITGKHPEKSIWWGDYVRWEKEGKTLFPGDLGRIYGAQWRNYGGKVDQLSNVIRLIKEDPSSRRIIITSSNPAEVDQMALPPCHERMQFFCHTDGGDGLSLAMVQRSCDMFLGVPFNISSYALLLCIIAKITGRIPHTLHIILMDAHIYMNHTNQMREVLRRRDLERRKSLQKEVDTPRLVLPKIDTIDDLLRKKVLKEINLLNYKSRGKIPADLNT